MENVTIFNHPLIQHKISILRNKNTGTNEFRSLIEEIAMLMGYEALRDLPTEEVEVETPIETCMTPMIAGKKLAVVPILRAGLGMVNGILALVPENHRCHRPDAGHRRLCRGCRGFHQAAWRKEDQIYGHYRSAGRTEAPARSTPGYPDLRRTSGPLLKRKRLHLPGTGRCRRSNLWNQIKILRRNH